MLFSLFVLLRVGVRIKNTGSSASVVYWWANKALMVVYAIVVLVLLRG